MLTKAEIEQILIWKFHPVKLIETDDSRSHAGHNAEAAKGNTHFSVEIVSPEFTGKKLIERHRMTSQHARSSDIAFDVSKQGQT